jgi:hypothetical protein
MDMKKNSWFVILLPVFFVLHGFVENFGFIPLKDAFVLCLFYVLATLLVWGIFFVVFKNWPKSALFTFFLMCFYFFFSAAHEFLKKHLDPTLFSRYSFLMPLFLFLFILLFVFLKRSQKSFPKVKFFLNALMLIYLSVDIVSAFARLMNPRSNPLSIYHINSDSSYKPCDSCTKPDIYFLLFDEYASSSSLKSHYNFNNDIDSFLIQKGFSIQKNSRSNYNFTPFSMASALNMDYIKGIKNVDAVSAEDYSSSYLLIKKNEVIRYLDREGYDIRNYSIFDLAGHPSPVYETLLPLNTRLITERTLMPHLRKDIGWIFINHFPLKLLFKDYFLEHRKNNEQFISLVKLTADQPKKQPVFVYAHLELPHPPFFFDKTGKSRDNKTVYQEFTGVPPVASYLGYVIYTNTRIREMVNVIQLKDPNAVIILLGDHGFRIPDFSSSPDQLFQNMNAVYFPDKNYRLLYDSVTNVNEFRILFNKLFHHEFALLKDSTIILKDK